jgi:RNA polymerase sigma-70 factor (ECF subfamily)
MAGRFTALTDPELFERITAARAKGEDASAMLGELVERWRRPAAVVVRRVQASYRAGSEDDADEIYQEAVRKLWERGLDQFRGISEAKPGAAASPKTFFLRIVKHAAIDAYRRRRERLEAGRPDEEELEASPGEIAQASRIAESTERREDASSLYWKAFERLEREHPNEAGAWDAYHHKDMEDHEACAKHLGITVANSYKRVSRAQAYLRRYLLELQESEE